MQTSWSVPTSAGTKVWSRWFKASIVQSLTKSWPQLVLIPSLSHHSQSLVFSITRWSPQNHKIFKNLIYVELQDWWEWGYLMCRPYAHSVMPLPAAPPWSKSVPLLTALIGSPARGFVSVAEAGWGSGGKPASSLTAAFTNRSLGKAELCFYFLPNPKNSLYQFTFPRLSWQGKVPESYFFLKRKPTLHV